MKTLITGAAGFIGSSVVREVLADGQDVRVLLRERDPRNIEDLEIESVKGDLLDADSLDRALARAARIFLPTHPRRGLLRFPRL